MLSNEPSGPLVLLFKICLPGLQIELITLPFMRSALFLLVTMGTKPDTESVVSCGTGLGFQSFG